MSSAEPLKSAISIRSSDDTSLALPSANEYHSREQRVKAQVQSLRRTKSRHSSSGRSGSTSLSPTSKRGLCFILHTIQQDMAELNLSWRSFQVKICVKVSHLKVFSGAEKERGR